MYTRACMKTYTRTHILSLSQAHTTERKMYTANWLAGWLILSYHQELSSVAFLTLSSTVRVLCTQTYTHILSLSSRGTRCIEFVCCILYYSVYFFSRSVLVCYLMIYIHTHTHRHRRVYDDDDDVVFVWHMYGEHTLSIYISYSIKKSIHTVSQRETVTETESVCKRVTYKNIALCALIAGFASPRKISVV